MTQNLINQQAQTHNWSEVIRLVQNGTKPTQFALQLAIESGNTYVSKYLLQNGCTLIDPDILEIVLGKATLEILQLYFAVVYPDDLLALAVQTGNLNLIQWLVQIGCSPHNAIAVIAAAEDGYADIVRYLLVTANSTELIRQIDQLDTDRDVAKLFTSQGDLQILQTLYLSGYRVCFA